MNNSANSTTPNLLAGKKGLIMGVANNYSIAWGIAQACAGAGAELVLSCQQVLKSRVEQLAHDINCQHVFVCDAGDSDNSLPALFKYIADTWGGLDFIVHAIAFADKEALRGRYLEVSQEQFLNCLNISCYSFTAVARLAAGLLRPNGSLVTLSYYGAEKAIPNYNVMGVAKAALEASVQYLALDLGTQSVRVNAISAGPIKTLAASGIGNFNLMLSKNAKASPLQTNVSQEDVGNAALFLLSDLSRNITGEVLHVDAGFHAVSSTDFGQ